MRAWELVNDFSMDPVRGQVLRVSWYRDHLRKGHTALRLYSVLMYNYCDAWWKSVFDLKIKSFIKVYLLDQIFILFLFENQKMFNVEKGLELNTLTATKNKTDYLPVNFSSSGLKFHSWLGYSTAKGGRLGIAGL